jgi:hypothetical protein
VADFGLARAAADVEAGAPGGSTVLHGVVTQTGATLAFSYFHGPVHGEIHVVAETYVVFLVTALLFSVAALGLETTLRNAAAP